MTLQDFFIKTFKPTSYNTCMRPRIFCVSGFNFSVQGSEGHYCRPRTTDEWYSEVEVGYPSEECKSILEYAENSLSPTDTVYGYVPVDLISKIIEENGGIDIEKTFNNKL